MKLFKRLWQDPKGAVGLVLVLAAVVVAIAAPYFAPHDPLAQDMAQRLAPPFWHDGAIPGHWLGTDSLGRDLASRIIFGARVSLIVATTATLLSLAVGSFLGLVSSYYGGWVDDVVTRLVEMQLAFPYVLLAVTVLTISEPGIWVVIAVLALGGWPTMCRVVRARAFSIKEREFVTSARAMGARSPYIIWHHLLPNVVSSAMVVAVVQVAQFVIAEATLSFLGLGVPPTVPSWGGIIDAGRDYIWGQWWLSTFPGIAIIAVVSGMGLLGDWLRDVIDPTVRT